MNRLNEVLRGVEELGIFQHPRRVPPTPGAHHVVLEGEVLVEGHEVLQLVLDPLFPLRLPRFILKPWDALGFLPHVDPNGWVCFIDPEGIVVDRRQPVKVVEEAFQRALRTLSNGVTGRERADFVNEFDVHWSRLPGGTQLISVLDQGNAVDWVNMYLGNETPPWVAHGKRNITAFRNGREPGDTLNVRKALYLPLEPGTLLIPPRPDGGFWTADDMRRVLLPGLSPANQERLQKLTKKQVQRSEYIIVKLPRPAGGAALFGIRCDRVGTKHPLVAGGTAKRLVPLQLHRLDRSYLVQRGGGDVNIQGKRVLIIGCGAVGGHLAFDMARTGVLDLTLVDGDTLRWENTYRHVLGRRYWGANKADALKEEIEAHLPYVHVRPVVDTIEGALATGSVDLADYDVVVLALGNPTVELEINERLHSLPNHVAAVFTWLEPLGIGGHALLAGRRSGGGCFECLYTAPDDEGC